MDVGLYAPGGSEAAHIRGVTEVLLTNALLVGALAWVLARWPDAPFGTATLLWGGTGVLMAGLEGYAHGTLAAGPLLGGLVADLLRTRAAPRWAELTVAAVVAWAVWFGIAAATFGLGWELEFWTGSLVFAGLTGAALHLLGPRPAAPAGSGEPARRTTLAGSRPS